MALSSTADRAVFTYRLKTGGPTWVTTLDIDHQDYDPVAACASLDVAWKQHMKVFAPTTVWLGQTWLYVQGDGGSTPHVSGSDTAGTSTGGNHIAPQVSWLLQKRTLTPGRFARGRMYVPCVPEDMIDDAGKLMGTVATQLSAAAQLFLDDVESAQGGQVIPVVHSGNAAGRPQANYRIDKLLASTACATQRRRLKR